MAGPGGAADGVWAGPRMVEGLGEGVGSEEEAVVEVSVVLAGDRLAEAARAEAGEFSAPRSSI